MLADLKHEKDVVTAAHADICLELEALEGVCEERSAAQEELGRAKEEIITLTL